MCPVAGVTAHVSKELVPCRVESCYFCILCTFQCCNLLLNRIKISIIIETVVSPVFMTGKSDHFSGQYSDSHGPLGLGGGGGYIRYESENGGDVMSDNHG